MHYRRRYQDRPSGDPVALREWWKDFYRKYAARRSAIMNTNWKLINVEERHAENPDGFRIASQAERESLPPGRCVKIGVENLAFGDERRANGERFWVRIVKVEGGLYVRYVAVIENDLVLGDAHGLKCGDTICFRAEHVLQTEPPPLGALPPPANAATKAFRARLQARRN